MKPAIAKSFITSIFSRAGVTINGNKPFDIQVVNEDFYRRVFRYGQLGLGESYMDGWWECDAMDQLIDRLLLIDLKTKISWNWVPEIKSRLFNLQRPSRAYEVEQ